MNNEKLRRRITRKLAREIKSVDYVTPFGRSWANAMQWARYIVNEEFRKERKAKR